MKKMSRIHFVGAILRKGEKILLLKNRSNEAKKDGVWWLPGGHLAEGESYMSSLKRELTEELKIRINPEICSEPLVLHAVDKKEQEVFLWRYIVCEQWEGTPKNNEPDQCSKIARFSENDLPSKISSYAKKAIGAAADGKHYVEFTQGEES